MENFTSLSILGWIHQMATIAWIGGMLINFLVLMPTVAKTLDPPTAGKFMGVLFKRYKVVIYSSLVILFFTGFAISGLSESYSDYYAGAGDSFNFYLYKHILIVVLAVLTVLAFEVLAPAVAKLAPQGPSAKLKKMQAQQKILALVGFIIAMAIVMLSVMMSLQAH